MAPKRKGQGSNPSAKRSKVSPQDFTDFYNSTLTLVYDLRDDSNERVLVNPFMKVPSKKQYPDYSKIVTDPISISDIQRKVRNGKYSVTSTGDFLSDFKLLLDNARLYNDPTSWIVDDATKIYEFVKDQVTGFSGDESEESLALEAKHLVEDVIDYNFPKIGVVSQPFMDVVDRDEYPDYFQVIKNPTSFNQVLATIDEIIDANDTVSNNLDRFYDKVHLIFTNAQSYNAEESLLYEDATRLSDKFEEKFEQLKAKFLPVETTKLKLTLKPSKVIEASPVPAPAPAQRGRKKKVIEEPEEEAEVDSDVEENSDEDDEEDDDIEEEEEEEEEEELAPVIPTLESNVMGRTQTLGSTEENFIQDAYIGSSASTVPQISSQIQEINGFRLTQPPSRYQLMKSSLFPLESDSISTLFEYKFPANGYRTQNYSLSLPPDSSSFITFGFTLHDYLYKLQESFGTGGSADEEFQCQLYVNEEEVQTSADVSEDQSDDQLRLNYDLKLSYGLNIVTFECKVAPSASKIIRTSEVKQEENEEVAGRHTRHQLQQMKMSWEVEKITFFIVCSSS